jgi:hypothetical protein
MPNQKTFAVIVSKGGGDTVEFRISASSFRFPGGEGGSYVFEAESGIVASFPRESVLAVIEETAVAKRKPL